jgi:hypothetical protein
VGETLDAGMSEIDLISAIFSLVLSFLGILSFEMAKAEMLKSKTTLRDFYLRVTFVFKFKIR